MSGVKHDHLMVYEKGNMTGQTINACHIKSIWGKHVYTEHNLYYPGFFLDQSNNKCPECSKWYKAYKLMELNNGNSKRNKSSKT